MNAPLVKFPGKLALQQRVLPTYRVPFFEGLAQACEGGFNLFAGEPRPVEAVKTANALIGGEFTAAQNIHLFSGPFYLCYQGGIVDWLERTQPDALVVEANSRYPSTPQAISWMQARGKPVLGWGLGAPPLSGRLAGIRKRSRQRFLDHLDGIISYSERGAAQYRAMGLPAERVFVAHNAAVPRPTAPPPERERPGSTLTLLFVGRLQERKKLGALFQACAEMPESSRPELLIVGDGPARSLFEAQAVSIFPTAKFLGEMHGEALRPIYAQADLFVLPGTGGLAVQQAMANGLPVIVAQGDGTQDDLVRPENGWMIPPDDQQALTATLSDALSDPQRLRQMGAASYRIAAEEINLEQMVAKFIRAVNTISQMKSGS